MDFYAGGYYLIKGSPLQSWMNEDLLPSEIFTPSSCLCELSYPSYSESFLSEEDAYKYLQAEPGTSANLKLIEIGLSCEFLAVFMEETPDYRGRSQINSNNRTVFEQRRKMDLTKNFRGFDVLGFEFGGFHSFICNSLETDFHVKLGLSLNSNGLFDKYSDAMKAADYAQDPEVGAEPVLWLPWAVLEAPIIANKRL